MNKTAIVIGATGLVGKAVVRLLDQDNSVGKVLTLTRRAVKYQSKKIENHQVDFSHLEDYAHLFSGDLLFSCMGTTLKQAGSIKAQRLVDVDYQYTAARLAVEQGVSHYLLVSSSGANAKSFSPYMKMKGELEEKVEALAFKQISIFQPSLLLGKRENTRLAEGLASAVMPAILKLPGLSRYRPIQASQVAQKMLEVSLNEQSGIQKYALDEVFPDS